MTNNKPKKSIWNSIESFLNKKQFTVIYPWAEQAWQTGYAYQVNEGYNKNATGYYAIDKIAAKCAEIPLRLYSYKNGEKVEVENHEILNLLQTPNPLLHTYESLVSHWVSYLKLSGNSYLFLHEQPNRGQMPKELHALLPSEVEGKFDKFGMPIQYTVRLQNTRLELPFMPGMVNQINHAKTFNPASKVSGYSALSSLRYPLQLSNTVNEYATNFVKNRCQPPGVLSSEKTFTDDQIKQIERQIDEKYAGASGSRIGRPYVFGGGMKYQSMAGPGREQASIVEGRAADERTIARTLGCPPILLGIPGDSTYNNISEAKRDFVLGTCNPLMWFFAQTLTNWLLTGNNENLFLEPDINQLPEVQAYLIEIMAKLETVSFLTKNEKRGLVLHESMGDAPVYNDLLIPPGIILAQDYDATFEDVDESDSELLNEDTDSDTDSDDEKRIDYVQCKTVGKKTARQKAIYRAQVLRIRAQLERRFKLQMQRYFRTQGNKLIRARKDMQSLGEAENIIESIINADSVKLRAILTRHYKASFKTFGKFLIAGAKKFSPTMEQKQHSAQDVAIDRYIQKNVGKHIQIMNKETLRRVRGKLVPIFETANEEGFSLQELSESIQGTYKDFDLKRAAVIARTETTQAVNSAGRETVIAMGLEKPTKTWLSDLRDTGRPEHQLMNNLTLPIHNQFQVPNPDGTIDAMLGPGDASAPAVQLCNCICVESYDAEGA